MKLHLTPASARAIQSLGKSSLAAALEAARKVRQTARSDRDAATAAGQIGARVQDELDNEVI